MDNQTEEASWSLYSSQFKMFVCLFSCLLVQVSRPPSPKNDTQGCLQQIIQIAPLDSIKQHITIKMAGGLPHQKEKGGGGLKCNLSKHPEMFLLGLKWRE